LKILAATKKVYLTYEISQVWYEDGVEVDKDTWVERFGTTRRTDELGARSIVENKIDNKYSSKTGEWDLEYNLIDFEEV